MGEHVTTAILPVMTRSVISWNHLALPGSMWLCKGGHPRNPLDPMRISALSFALAPLALVSIGGLEAKAYPMGGQSESITCALIGNDRMTRAMLGCPRVIGTGGGNGVAPPESITCALIGDDRLMRAGFGCSMF